MQVSKVNELAVNGTYIMSVDSAFAAFLRNVCNMYVYELVLCD